MKPVSEEAPAHGAHAALAGYEIVATLHVGTKAMVYRARRPGESATCVLKTQRTDHPSAGSLRRLRAEFDLLRDIADERVVHALDFVPDGNRTVLVLEDVSGTALRRLLEGGPLPLTELWHVGTQLAEALSAVHAAGVMHKDINPSNVLLLPGGAGLRIIDFDIASRAPRETRHASPPRALEGTLGYLAPEQSGRVNQSVDARADLYGLGVTLFEAATGRLPFESADPMQLLHAHIARRPPLPSSLRAELPPAFDRIVMHLLEKRPEDRYQSAAGVAGDLQHIVERYALGDKAPDFDPGHWDHPLRFQIPERLYGREDEVRRLLAAFQQAANGRAGLALVAGEPGAGKSRLVGEIRRPIVEREGTFVSGKFDQFKRDVPFASLAQALRSLAQQLLAETPDRLEPMRARLRTALGPNAAVLADLIPEIDQLLGPLSAPPELGPIEAQNRFQVALGGFVEVFCRPDHPLCLVLDDLQWADAATLMWLEKTLARDDAHHFFLVGAYRHGEVPAGHPLLTTVARLERRRVPVEWLEIRPLQAETVDLLVAEALLSAPADARPLSRLVYRKTHGNPFFVMQCLESFEESGAISYDATARHFAVDLSRAEQAPIAENVVDFMVDRLRRLPENTQSALRVGACLGNAFALGALRGVTGLSEAEAHDALEPAIEEGLILPRDAVRESEDAIFVFLHDRVQQAAYALTPESERQALHLSLGRSILADMSAPETDDRLFDALGHIAAAADAVTDPAERQRLAAHFLTGAERARRSTAYEPGLHFAGRGLLLTEGADAPRGLRRMLFLERAELSHLTGDDAAAEQGFQSALGLAETPMERVGIRERQVHFHTNRADFQAAYDTGRAAVAELGFKLPAGFVPPLFVKDLLRALWRLRGRSIEKLSDLPVVSEPKAAAALRLIGALLKSAYQIRPELCVHNATLGVLLSLRHGNAKESAISYLVFGGIFLGGIAGRHARGHAFGKLALGLVEKLHNPWLRAEVQFVRGYFATSWLEPAKSAEQTWRLAWHSGVDVGDFFHAGCAASGIVQSLFMRGAPLDEVQAEIERFMPFLQRIGNRENTGTLRGIRQCVEVLRAEEDAYPGFDLEGFDTAAYEADLATWGSRHFAHHWFVDKAAVQVLYGEVEAARVTLSQAEPLLKDSTGMLHGVEHLFWAGLVDALTPLLPGVPKRLAAAEKRFAALAKQNPANFEAKAMLLRAEVLRRRGQAAEAAFAYERAAIRGAADALYPVEALAQERAADLHLAAGRRSMARYAVSEAIYALKRWGATALARRLGRRWPELLPNFSMMRTSVRTTDKRSHVDTTVGEESDLLDLNSVIKAAEAISSEVQLRALLERLLDLVMENAGAERGALVLVEKGELVVQAEAHLGDPVRIERVPLAESTTIARTAVHYAARSLTVVVEDDAAAKGHFVDDPHVRDAHVRSLLAMPLLNRGVLRAVIYLENPLVVGAFTQNRLAPLRVLSGPMAVSLDNALLWDSLERTYQATRRFVPFEFLEALGKKTIVEVSRGDHAQLVTTVMFVDLRGFTTLCEGMTPGETYAFINEYLSRIEPAITENGGFIQHFLGDGILALFCRQSSADDASRAALGMLAAVEHFNDDRQNAGLPPIAIGIGMNTGALMLGTIGGRERLDANVIGDAVNLAARVEGQTKHLGAVLMTETTHAGLADASRFALREVDRVIVKGRSAAVSLFELTPSPRPTAALFGEGLTALRQGDLGTARLRFEGCLDEDRGDLAAAVHLQRCHTFEAQGLPENWDGVLRLDAK